MRTTLFTMIAVLMVGIVPQVNAQADLTDFVPDDDTVSGQNFTLDGTGSAGSGDIIQLEFGSVLNEYLQFDVDDDRFELSNDLSLEGAELQDFRVENLASDPVTCSGGVSGRLYFNTGSNELQLCDGSSWGGVSGSGGVVDQTNVVYVDGTRAAQTGEVYNTLAAAVSYINTQSPGSGNPWVILIEPGTNTESVTIPTYTVLVGRDRESTTLTGTITLSANSALQNLTVNGGGEVDIANGTTGYITSSDVNIDDGASGGIDGTLIVSHSFVDGVIGATGALFASESILGVTSLVNNGSVGTFHSSVLTFTNNNIWNNFATAYDNSVLSAGSQLNATTTQEAIDELVEQGTPNTIWTLDKNNAGSGVNVDIVANQGSDNDGTLRYNATTNQWEISNDGGSFQSIATGSAATELAAVQARRSASFSVSSAGFVDVTFNATDVENDVAVLEHDNTNTDRILVKEDGIYQIAYDFGFLDLNGSGTYPLFSGRVRTNDAAVINGSTAQTGLIDFSNPINQNVHLSKTFIASLSSGDFLSFQLQSDLAGFSTVANATFVVITLEGIEGPQGPQGPAGGGASTLDEAYDGGGSGLGRTITADAGAVDINGAGLEVDNVVLNDNTISSLDVNGNLAFSPSGTGKLLFNAEVDFEDVTIDPGSPAEGTLWFRSDTGNLRFFADSRTQEVQTVAIAQVYQSGTTTFNAITPITWNGTNAQARIVDSTYTHSTSTNPSRVTVNDSGLYEVSYSIAWDTTANSRRTATCSFRVNGSAVATGVGTTHSYSRNDTDDRESNSTSFLYAFTGGSYYEIACQSVGTSGSITTIANQSWTKIRLVRRQ